MELSGAAALPRCSQNRGVATPHAQAPAVSTPGNVTLHLHGGSTQDAEFTEVKQAGARGSWAPKPELEQAQDSPVHVGAARGRTRRSVVTDQDGSPHWSTRWGSGGLGRLLATYACAEGPEARRTDPAEVHSEGKGMGSQVAHLAQRERTPVSPAGPPRQETGDAAAKSNPRPKKLADPRGARPPSSAWGGGRRAGRIPTLAVTMCSPKCRIRSPCITRGNCSSDSRGSAAPSRRKHR